MPRFLIRRFLQSLLSLLLISFLVFTMMYAVADPVQVLLPPTATARDRAILRKDLGLDKPMLVQYFVFLGRAFRGDFGRSFDQGQSVRKLIAERVPATLELSAAALLISMVIGISLGIVAGAWPRGFTARSAMWGSMVGISLPTFWLGLLLMMFFGVQLRWLPPQGRGATVSLGGVQWSFLTVDGLRHLILPALTLSLHHLAMLIRLVRSELFDTLKMPFIRVARSYGLSERTLIGRYAMRNTLIPIITVTGVEIGQLIAFSVVTETIFEWPGLGKLLIQSIEKADRPVVVTYLLMTGLLFVILNLLVDLTYALVDPRIRLARRESVA